MNFKIRTLAVMVAVVCLAGTPPIAVAKKAAAYKEGSCAKRLREVKTTKRHWQAVARNVADSKRNFVCATFFNQPSKAAAIRNAIQGCEREAAIKPPWGLKGTCYVWAVR